MKPLRFALVGSSGFAASMAGPALVRSPSAELSGVLGSTPERGARLGGDLGTSSYGSFEALVADESLDAVWVAAHDALHEPLGSACLAAGRHLLVEKPMATTAAEARKLLAAAERAGRVLRVGCHQRFRPGHRALRDLASGGSLGALTVVKLHFGGESPGARRAGSGRPPLAARGGAGVAKEFGAPPLALLLGGTGGGASAAGAVLETRRWAVETDDN